MNPERVKDVAAATIYAVLALLFLLSTLVSLALAYYAE